MHSEVLIYGYGLVCLSMLAFNVVYSIYLRADQVRISHRTVALEEEMERQLARISESGEVDGSHIRSLVHYLGRIGDLLAFDALLTERAQEPAVKAYIRQLEPAFLLLADTYRRREEMQAAYFCHFLATHLEGDHDRAVDPFQRAVLAYLDKPGLYCRINALRALCAFGGVQSIVEALLLLSERKGAQLSGKVIVEALLQFHGDREQLIAALWACFDRFDSEEQRALLDFMRFASGNWQAPVLDILRDPSWDKELRLSAIRYFDRYPYAPCAGRRAALGLGGRRGCGGLGISRGGLHGAGPLSRQRGAGGAGAGDPQRKLVCAL